MAAITIWRDAFNIFITFERQESGTIVHHGARQCQTVGVQFDSPVENLLAPHEQNHSPSF
jgi:hypothetical protein